VSTAHVQESGFANDHAYVRRVTRIGVIYYGATGNVHAHAGAVADGAAVRLRLVAELPPDMLISFKQH